MYKSLVCLAGFFIFASACIADVNYGYDADAPSESVGFIGRGDIIGNIGKEALVDNPVVTLVQSSSFEVVIQWETGQKTKKVHTIRKKYKANISGVVLANPRKAPGNGNITGYILGSCSLSGEDGDGPVPQVGDVILDNDNIRKVVVEVNPIDDGTSGEVLTFDAGNGLVGKWLLDSEGIGTFLAP